jgi:hypothetical protein
MIFPLLSYCWLWLPSAYLSQFLPKPSFSHMMPHISHQALNYANLQLTTYFVEPLVKHLDLPLLVKRLPTRKLTQNVLPLSRYA